MIPASSVQTSTHWSNSTSCVSEKQNPGTARQHPVHTSKRPRHDTHTASVVFIESVDAQSCIAIVSKSHPVDPQTPQLVDLGSKLSRTAQWPACKTLPWMKTRGHKKTKERLVQPSRAEPSSREEETFQSCLSVALFFSLRCRSDPTSEDKLYQKWRPGSTTRVS